MSHTARQSVLGIRPSALALLLLCRDAASDINLGHVESRVPNRLRGAAFDNEILTEQPPPAAPLALSSSCAAIFFRHLEKTGGQSIEALLVQAGYEKVESIRFGPSLLLNDSYATAHPRLLVHYHSPFEAHAPAFLRLLRSPVLSAARAAQARRGCLLLTLTVLRDPASHYPSAFECLLTRTRPGRHLACPRHVPDMPRRYFDAGRALVGTKPILAHAPTGLTLLQYARREFEMQLRLLLLPLTLRRAPRFRMRCSARRDAPCAPSTVKLADSRAFFANASRAAELANAVLSRVDVVGVASRFDVDEWTGELMHRCCVSGRRDEPPRRAAGDIALRLSPSSQSSFRPSSLP